MTIGAAWNVDNPDAPWADWDTDANIAIPIGLDDWLSKLGTIYGSHQVIANSPLECLAPGVYSAGAIGVRIKVADAAVFTKGKKYPFTVRVVGADGVTQDDRTFWLKLKDR